MNPNVIGDFKKFREPELSMDEILERALANRSGNTAPIERTSLEIADLGTHRLVRYILGSDEFRNDLWKIESNLASRWTDTAHLMSVLGLINSESDEAEAVFVLYDKHGFEREVTFGHPVKKSGVDLDGAVVAEALDIIGLPGTHKNTRDFANLFDVWYDEENGWSHREPKIFIVVPMERTCYAFGELPRPEGRGFLLR